MAVDMVPQAAPEREFRGPGCTDFCRVIAAIVPGVFGRTELLLHDARSHEAFGRAQVVMPGGLTTHDIATGPLLIRPLTADAYVDGEPLKLTPTELKILAVLARNIGGLVSREAILHEVWGAACWDEYHVLRVNIARIRAKLGAAAPLLETRIQRGYVLRIAAYTGPTP